jgi:serine/threonine protein phosphatase PrpC
MPASLDEAAGQLIDAANEAGGKDNVTVVLLRYTE